MFLIAVTKNKLALPSGAMTVNEVNTPSAVITAVTDNRTSKFIGNSGGFSVIQAPLIKEGDYQSGLFSEVAFQKDMLSIFKSTCCPGAIYFHFNGSGEFFCATHIHWLRKAAVPIDENPDALPEFFTYRFIMPPNTIFKDIQQLSSGSRLKVILTPTGCRKESFQEYAPPSPQRTVGSLDEEIDRLIECMARSLDGFKPYQGRVTSILSGGIDSSITFKLTKKYLNVNHSISTEYPFEDPRLNTERAYALTAAMAMGAEHHLFESTVNDYLRDLLECMAIVEEPLHHLQTVSMLSFFKKAIPDKSIIVQGLGGGGIVGNFRNFLYWKEKSASRIFKSKTCLQLLNTVSQITGKAKHFTNCMNKVHSEFPLSDPKNLIWDWHAFGNKQWVCRKFNLGEEGIIQKRYEIYKSRNVSIYDLWSLYSLLGDEAVTNALWGKIAEANGKTLYSPMYDQQFLDYAFSLPWSFKLSKPENKIRKGIGKHLGVPDFILNRPKSGFGVVQKKWAEKDGPFEPLVSLAQKIIPVQELRAVQNTNPQDSMIFWNLVNYALWKRLIIHQEPLDQLKTELDKGIESRHG